jgi:hypothetical protein
MKRYVLIFFLALLIISCGKGKKIDVENISFSSEDSFFVYPNPNQTPDSVIIYNARDTITPAGDSIYIITTRFDKRIIDGVIEGNKNNPNPVSFTVPGTTYRLQKKSFLKITAYDTSGYEFKALFDKELPPGEYKVNNSIYSTLPGGKFFIEIIYDDKRQLRRVGVGF